jgi:hypothetical protein
MSSDTFLTVFPPIEASSIDRAQQSRFHMMTREEPSLETLWLKNIKTMDKVPPPPKKKKISQ